MSKSNVSFIITIVAAVLAVAAVVILLVTMNAKPEEPELPVITGFQVTQELADECTAAAQKLVSDNYSIIRLYVTEGLPLEIIYGSVPEPIDGYYMTDSEKFTDFSQIEELVKSVYASDAAGNILRSVEVRTKDGSMKELEVYKACSAYGDTFLGMNELFSVDKDYTTDWSSCYVEVKPKSETECDVTVYVNGITAEQGSENPESVLGTSMVKTSDGWRLTKLLK